MDFNGGGGWGGGYSVWGQCIGISVGGYVQRGLRVGLAEGLCKVTPVILHGVVSPE